MPNLLTHLTIGDKNTTINSVHYIVGTGSTAGTWLGADSSIKEYYDGLTIAYKVPVAGASETKLNINNLGAKTVYRQASSKVTTHYPVGSVILLVYTTNSSSVGSWQCTDYDSNTTYSNASLGQGYGTCATAEATAAKTVTLANYALTVGGIVVVKFTHGVPVNATLNVNSKGAKPIYYHGAAITAHVIKAGDTVTFIYDGNYYHLLSIDDNLYFAMSANRLGLGKPAWHYYQSTATCNGNAWGGSTSPSDAAGVKTIDINLPSTTAGRYYGIEADKEGRLFVNVPWSSGGSYTLPTASSSIKGGIKVGTGLSMSSDTMSVSYGTSSTTAAVGNDSRFGKTSITKLTHREEDTSYKHYKLGFINSSLLEAQKEGDLSATAAGFAYLPSWYVSDGGYMRGFTLSVGNLFVKTNASDSSSLFSANSAGIICDTSTTITAGNVLKFNKINIPTTSGGSTYGTGSSGKVLKSNGTTVYWGDDNNTTYTFKGAVSTIKDSNLTANRALISNGSGKVAVSSVTSTQLGYLSGVTSNIQTQLNGKLTQTTADARYALKSEINSGTTSVQILTRAEYNALTNISANVLYIVRG